MTTRATWVVGLGCFLVGLFCLRGCVRYAESRGDAEANRGTGAESKAGAKSDFPNDSCERLGKAGETQVFIGMGTLTYCEGKKAGLPFTWEPKDPKGDVCILEVPSAARWPTRFPQWAHGRRDEILANIKRITTDRGWNFQFREY